jgi:hypothetical protein
MSDLSLFPDQNGNATNKIVQIQRGATKQSKEHQAFDKLIKRIDSVQRKIDSETKKLETLLSLYQSEVFPKLQELCNLKIKLSHLLHEKRMMISLSKKQNEKLNDVIIDLLDDAFSIVEPDEKTKEMYNNYTGGDIDSEIKEEEGDLKQAFSEMFYKQFGLKLDPTLLEGTPDFTKIEEELTNQIKEKESDKKPKKKTKKQAEREMLERHKDELKKKSLRSVYLSLAKLLHPDTEQDENLRLEKEEIMKKVTTAYDNKDMMGLLKIEMQWVKTHEQSLHKTDVNTLTAYVLLLRDQLKQLEFELHMVYNNPKYAEVMEYQTIKDSISKNNMMYDAREYDSTNQIMAGYIRAIEQSEVPTRPIKQVIEFYYTPNDDVSYPNIW